MLKVTKKPARVVAAGSPPKTIEEFIGRVASGSTEISIARMVSPSGWKEPGQIPEFDEYTIVLRGQIHLETKNEVQDIFAGQGVMVPRGEWVRYSTPGKEGAEYIAICVPAFSPEIVHRETQ